MWVYWSYYWSYKLYFKDILVVNFGNIYWGIWLYYRFGYCDIIVRSLIVFNINNLIRNWFDCFYKFLFVVIWGFVNYWVVEKFKYLEDLFFMVVKLMFLLRDIFFYYFLRE